MIKHCRYQQSRRLVSCLVAILAGCGLGAPLASAGVKVVATNLTSEEAAQHAQETNTVCGPVASTHYAERSPDKPTYLNFDRPFPHQTFTAVIAESARAKFKDAPEVTFKGKNICVTGLITTNSHGKAEMSIVAPSQITIQDTAPPATNQLDDAAGK